MNFKLGLTGSIGMGKSTTAQLFAEQECEIWDADAAVHRMYSSGGAAVDSFRQTFPRSIHNNAISRRLLKEIIACDPTALRKIEKIVHPLVAKDREIFIHNAQADILVFDIPLLFEGGGHEMMDAVACVTVSPEIQEKRVMERGTMSKEQFQLIRSKQMPNTEKMALSDFVIETDTIEIARSQVQNIVSQIRKRPANA